MDKSGPGRLQIIKNKYAVRISRCKIEFIENLCIVCMQACDHLLYSLRLLVPFAGLNFEVVWICYLFWLLKTSLELKRLEIYF